LRSESVERALEIAGHVLTRLRPFEEDAQVVDFLGQAVAQLDVFGEPALPLQGLLGFFLLVPETGRGDLLFELG
jgi:hypothetical protein